MIDIEKGNTVLYFSVFDWPKDGKLKVSGISRPVISANLLAGGTLLKTRISTDGLEISVLAVAPDAIASVIRVTIKGETAADQKDGAKKMKTGALD